MAGTPLGTALRALADTDPDRPALTHDDRSVSRRELDLRTNRLARAYAELGVKADSFVTIGLPNGIEFFEATIAAWKLGATPQPVSAKLPRVERDAIIALAQPSLVVGFADLEDGGPPSVAAGFVPDPGLSDSPLPPKVASSFKAPTSGGSTGRPKLIVATQPAVLESLVPLAQLLRMTDGGVHLLTGPLYHNGPLSCSLCALVTGNEVVIMGRFDAERTLALVEKHRVDWLYLVPTMMQRIWRLPPEVRTKYDLSSLRAAMHMAAPCPPWLKKEWIDWLGDERILELYGGTEAQAFTEIRGDEWLAHPGSVGRAVLGEVRVLDAEGKEAPPGQVGEVWMRRGEGAKASYRYVGAKAKVREGGWESLGDLGHVDADGYLYLADRETDMILVGGANVYPAEIEAALDEHPAVGSSCVIGLPHEDLGNVPHALVQLETPASDAELLAHLGERLAKYKLPRTIERVTEPLRSEAGKVRRSALRAERMGTERMGTVRN
jgi:bile acid-coenzyme A ligase